MKALTNEWIVEPDNVATPTAAKFEIMKKLPTILRTLGAGALILAMYSFLFQGWQSGNDVLRYLLMLAHTGALAAIGLASGHWLKESKGARLLLTLALVSVPANFAILGAFIFSQSAGVDISHYPNYVAWTVNSLQTAMLTTGGAMLILAPVVLLGFTVLARSISKKLSLLFLVSNAALLLPLRDPQLIGILVLVLAFFTILISRKTAHSHTAAKTQEGLTALALQLLPLGVLVGRSLWLYSLDLFLLTALSVTIFFLLRQISLYLKNQSKWRQCIDAVSLLPIASVALCLSNAFYNVSLLPLALIIPVSVLVSAAMVYDISLRSHKNAAAYRRTAAIAMLFSLIPNLIIFSNILATMSCVAGGLLMIVLGFKAQQRSIFAGGILLMVTGLTYQLYHLTQHFDLAGWATIATLGVAAIVIASAMESQGGKFKLHLDSWKETFKQWEI